jgi:hypothetical protein
MIVEKSYIGHSAQVQMRLLVNGSTIGITQMGPDFIFIEPAADHPPGDATILFKVDDNERHWKVRLPEGISAESERVVIAASE